MLVEDGDSFRFQEVNPATLRLYGMARDDVVGRTAHEVLGPEGGAEVTRNLAAALHTDGPYRYERTQAGKTIEAVATAVPSGDEKRGAWSSARAT